MADAGSGLGYLAGRRQGVSREQAQDHGLDISLSHKMSRQSGSCKTLSCPLTRRSERSEVPSRGTFLRSHSDLEAEWGPSKCGFLVLKISLGQRGRPHGPQGQQRALGEEGGDRKKSFLII